MRFIYKPWASLAAGVFFACLQAQLAAQQPINAKNQINWVPVTGSGEPGPPAFVCDAKHYGQPYLDISVTPNVAYTCGSDGWAVRGGGGSGTVNSGTAGQAAVYPIDGTSVQGGTLGLSGGGTGAVTAPTALSNLQGISSVLTTPQTMAGPLNVPSLTATSTIAASTAISAPNGFETTNIGNQTVVAWGNSIAQGYNPPITTSITAHPPTAWPALFADRMGWSLNNQAYGSSNCADLSYMGTSESLWAQTITTGSINIYAHYLNDLGQADGGPNPGNMDVIRGCVQAEAAWLAIPETQKVRASAGTTTGSWTFNDINSSTAFATTNGATWSASVWGKIVYLVVYLQYGTGTPYSQFTVSVDGNLITNPMTKSTTWANVLYCSNVVGGHCNPGFPVNEDYTPYLIRVPNLQNVNHTVLLTCTNLNPSAPCRIGYAAAVNSDNQSASAGPVVYFQSPEMPLASVQTGNWCSGCLDIGEKEWKVDVMTLRGDGLPIVPVDVANAAVVNPNDAAQWNAISPVHPSQPPAPCSNLYTCGDYGAVNMAQLAVAKATLAAQPLDRAESPLQNTGIYYGSFWVGAPPTNNGCNAVSASSCPVPSGSVWSSNSTTSGTFGFGSDSTTYLTRFDSGSYHILLGQSNDGKPVQFQTNIADANDSGGFESVDPSDGTNIVLKTFGSSAYEVSDWVSKGAVTTSKPNGLILDADAGGSVSLEVSRTSVFKAFSSFLWAGENIGVGVTFPSYAFEMANNGCIASKTASGAEVCLFKIASTNDIYFGDLNGSDISASLRFRTAGSDRFWIDASGNPTFTNTLTVPGGSLLQTSSDLTNGAASSAATLTNAPTVGNPTKWIPISDNGITRYIPAW